MKMIHAVIKPFKLDEVREALTAIAVDEALVEPTVDAIQRAARTGKIGDGKIFVMELTQAVRVRTGEVDALAL